jgi:phosphoglucosamine mutase
MLEAALVAGITSAGGDALLAGIVPTPAVALLVREHTASGGVVISASHNPPEYNGIKFFDAEGFKLTQEVEDAFEERLQRLRLLPVEEGRRRTLQGERFACFESSASPGSSVRLESSASPGSSVRLEPSAGFASPASPVRLEPSAGFASPASPASPASFASPGSPGPPVGADVGTVIPLEDARERYVTHAVGIVRSQGLDLAGLHIAVDCGHGASFATTPETLRRLGATVTAINTDFNGTDINVACGSTHLRPLKALVAETGADVGIAHDGDADRMLAVDEVGNELDGDFIEAICAVDLKEQGRLANDTVVSTVVCNLGFISAMRERGIKVVQTAVGDRHVLEAMREGGFILGGEQTGHTILLEHNSTGDGLASALQLLAAMKRTHKSLGSLSHVMVKYPQVNINVKVADKEGLDSSAALAQAIREAEERLGEQGRVLIRPSGTEPLIRVMVEATDEQQARDEAQRLASVVDREFG